MTVEDIWDGSHSAVYFDRAEEIALYRTQIGHDTTCVMQVFQRKENTVLAGMRHVLGLLDESPWRNRFRVLSLNDGDVVQPWEPVLRLEGKYEDFAVVESVYLGILARCSRVATNMRNLVNAANGKPVYFFGDRFDLPHTQAFDAYAVEIGGATAVCTPEMANACGLPAVGTMPHALIAIHGGDVVEACRSFRKCYPQVPMHALVDFNNDCVGDSLRCLAEFGEDLAGVRLDTSGALVDKSLVLEVEKFGAEGAMAAEFYGVNPNLVQKVRRALDSFGGEHVKITVSGGYNVQKVLSHKDAPVDIFAVGSSVVTSNPIDFTADLVRPAVKVGRSEQDSSRLTLR